MDFEMEVKVHEAYYRIFNTPDGELVLDDMKKAHHYQSSSYDPRADSITTFNEGERNVVLRIIAILNSKPGKENKNDRG